MGEARDRSTRMAEASFWEELIAHVEYLHSHQNKHKTVIESDDIEESDGDDAYLPLLPGEGVETNTELSFYFIVYQTEYSIVRLFLGYSILIRFRIFVLALIAEAQLAYDFCWRSLLGMLETVLWACE